MNTQKKRDNITDEMKELFIYINTYQPEEFALIPQLKCFIPDYIPAVGDIDPIIKVRIFTNIYIYISS